MLYSTSGFDDSLTSPNALRVVPLDHGLGLAADLQIMIGGFLWR
jgi:hypothetical protein